MLNTPLHASRVPSPPQIAEDTAPNTIGQIHNSVFNIDINYYLPTIRSLEGRAISPTDLPLNYVLALPSVDTLLPAGFPRREGSPVGGFRNVLEGTRTGFFDGTWGLVVVFFEGAFHFWE